jgi:hypothetical protein
MFAIHDLPEMTKINLACRLFWAAVLCFAIATGARAQDLCEAPVKIERKGRALARLDDYRPIFRECRSGARAKKLAIREMKVNGASLLLVADPSTLETSLERASCWSCEETTEDIQKDTRFMRALRAARVERPPPRNGALFNGGLIHGAGGGAFLTGDLCPSRRPLDRKFFEQLADMGKGTPVALAVAGQWIARHGAEFDWLQEKARSGALDISWVNHSYHHPYVHGRADAHTYLLTPGVDLDKEILDTERILVAHGATPSAFFRFPGLMSDAALMEKLARYHLIALGAENWLVLSPAPTAGSILLVHPNGNEPEGLRLFSKLLREGKMPQPFRAITQAP